VRTYHIPLDELGFAGMTTAARAYVPTQRDPAQPIFFAFPGGGHSKWYYDPDIGSRDDYSMARYFAARGCVFVACDHLGVGESSYPGADTMTIELLVAVNALTVRAVLDALVRTASGRPGRQPPGVIGIGHSMAGGLLTMQQAAHRSYHGLALLGWSAFEQLTSDKIAVRDGIPADGGGALPAHVPPGYLARRRGRAQRYCYYWEDVPADVIEADTRAAVAIPPALGPMNEPGIVTAEAARIDVPLLVAVGERDLCEEPRREPQAYLSSEDISLLIVPRSGHNHNLSGGRAALWRRVVEWGRAVEASRGLRPGLVAAGAADSAAYLR
jgi:pimeloyl-ACP methyl ester carboxylesterase